MAQVGSLLMILLLHHELAAPDQALARPMDDNAKYVLAHRMIHARDHILSMHLLRIVNRLASDDNSPLKGVKQKDGSPQLVQVRLSQHSVACMIPAVSLLIRHLNGLFCLTSNWAAVQIANRFLQPVCHVLPICGNSVVTRNQHIIDTRLCKWG